MMSETVKVNLTKTLAILTILSIVAGAIWGTAMVYAGLDGRIDSLELKQATFEGIIDERTRQHGKRLDAIYDIVKEWRPAGAGISKEDQGQVSTQEEG